MKILSLLLSFGVFASFISNKPIKTVTPSAASTVVVEELTLLNTTIQALHATYPTLVRHKLTDAHWQQFVYKGSILLKQTISGDADASKYAKNRPSTIQSKFINYPQNFATWGYEGLAYDDFFDFEKALPLKPALQSLGVSDMKKSEGGHNFALRWDHEKEVTINGVKYPRSGASYITILNPLDGVLIAWSKYSPAYMGPKQDPPVHGPWPDLKAWSDIVFLQWWGATSTINPRNLKYIFSSPVENAATTCVIDAVLSRSKQQLSEWPGVDFGTNNDFGKAILGSPNGLGAAFILSQHKRQLGIKTISKVRVFQDAGKAKPRPPTLLFYVTDVPP